MDILYSSPYNDSELTLVESGAIPIIRHAVAIPKDCTVLYSPRGIGK